MPTRKQRRRQQKSRRHEYEYIYVDDEGNEVEVDPNEVAPQKVAAKSDTKAPRSNGRRPATNTRGRTIDPPSWRRAARRGLIFAPLLIVVMFLLNGNDVPVAQQIAPAIFLIAFFIPFSYFTDSLAYRMYQKRLARRDAPKSR